MPGRQFSGEEYRYGFQGQETDKEWLGGAVSFKYRVHDARIGRFLSVDPLAPNYPHNSPYAFSENRVIDGVELEGLEFLRISTISIIPAPKIDVVNGNYVSYTINKNFEQAYHNLWHWVLKGNVELGSSIRTSPRGNAQSTNLGTYNLVFTKEEYTSKKTIYGPGKKETQTITTKNTKNTLQQKKQPTNGGRLGGLASLMTEKQEEIYRYHIGQASMDYELFKIEASYADRTSGVMKNAIDMGLIPDAMLGAADLAAIGSVILSQEAFSASSFETQIMAKYLFDNANVIESGHDPRIDGGFTWL